MKISLKEALENQELVNKVSSIIGVDAQTIQKAFDEAKLSLGEYTNLSMLVNGKTVNYQQVKDFFLNNEKLSPIFLKYFKTTESVVKEELKKLHCKYNNIFENMRSISKEASKDTLKVIESINSLSSKDIKNIHAKISGYKTIGYREYSLTETQLKKNILAHYLKEGSMAGAIASKIDFVDDRRELAQKHYLEKEQLEAEQSAQAKALDDKQDQEVNVQKNIQQYEKAGLMNTPVASEHPITVNIVAQPEQTQDYSMEDLIGIIGGFDNEQPNDDITNIIDYEPEYVPSFDMNKIVNKPYNGINGVINENPLIDMASSAMNAITKPTTKPSPKDAKTQMDTLTKMAQQPQTEVSVDTAPGKSTQAQLIGVDKVKDMAVIKKGADISVVDPSTVKALEEDSNLDGEDIVCMNVPLITRLFEYFNEEQVEDVQLHLILENLLRLQFEKKVLTMQDYDEIIGNNISKDMNDTMYDNILNRKEDETADLARLAGLPD